VAFVGHTPEEIRAQIDPLFTIRSIESEPISRGLTMEMRIILVVGGVGLLVPIIVFVATATRLAAARREQRLAAMRLAGATHQQVGVVAAVEAAIAAVGGTAVGFGAFLAIRPSLARIPFDGASFYPSDLHLSLPWAAAIALGVPALAVAAAIVSLRRVRISPLGVARRAAPSRPTPRPLLLVAGGVALLTAAAVWARRSTAEDAEAYAVGLAFVMMIVGIVLSGPWLTAVVARGLGRFGRRAPSLLAARRLEDNPAAGFRAISGIILAVFVGTVFSALASSVMIGEHGRGSGLDPDVVGAATEVRELPPPPEAGGDRAPAGSGMPERPEVEPARAAQLAQDLDAIPGVRRVVTGHRFPDDPDLFTSLIRSGADIGAPVVVSCEDGAALGFDDGCNGADGGLGTMVLNMDGPVNAPTGGSSPVPASALADLPVVAVAAVTDGSESAVERARTQIELAIPGAAAVTQADIDAETQQEFRTMERVTNIGLSMTLVIAGCSLAVAVAGAIVERKQPFALLRLTGTRLSELRRMVLAEAATPLLAVAGASVTLGLVVAALILAAGGGDRSFALPGISYWLALVGGLAAALMVVLATLPLLTRLTALDSARFE
jgi:predicted lysophospholipase L1 biosynthesis ABC-type transport system permease subunit